MTELRTERLILRHMSLDDAAELHEAVVGQHDVMRWLSSGCAQDLATAREMCRDHEQHWLRHGFGDFAARDTRDERFLGRVGLRHRPQFGVDLGFAMHPDAMGRGIATEAGRACLDLAFGGLGMTEVLAFVLPDNARSIALVTRLGASGAGTVTSSGRQCLRFRFEAPASSARAIAADGTP